MDLRRFLDLYVSETQEHVRLLHRSLLALEGDDSADAAVDEAFRAAHTLKGLSAAMGYAEVADIAHQLEDRLSEVRAGRLPVTGTLVDALLGDADAVEDAIARAVATMPAGGVATAPVTQDVAADRTAVSPPPDTLTVARVRLQQDAPIKSARALLIMRSLADSFDLLGSHPAEFDDAFAGEFLIFFGAGADPAAAGRLIRSAGDIDSVDFLTPAQLRGPPPGRGAAATPAVSAPARQLRVDAGRLDGLADGIGELSVLYAHFAPADDVPAGMTDMLARMGTLLTGLQREVLALRMVPVREAFERLPRVVRDAARRLDRDVDLVVEGDDVELDRAILDEIGDPLVHLLRNAVDHGIEPATERVAAGKGARGRIRLRAERERSSVRILLQDDGRGVARAQVVQRAISAGLLAPDASDEPGDEELFRLLSHPGLSTAEEVSDISGRGVGMDVVVSRIRALGGAIDMHTEAGAGTTFSIRLPITLALAQALRVRIGDEEYAIPLTHITEAVELNGNGAAGDVREQLELRGELLPLVRMRTMLEVDAAGAEQVAVITEIGERRAALAVDELIGSEQILVKSFDPVSGTLPYFSGATMLADGRPALVLDPLSVI